MTLKTGIMASEKSASQSPELHFNFKSMIIFHSITVNVLLNIYIFAAMMSIKDFFKKS